MIQSAVGGYVLDVSGLVGACCREPYPEAVVWGTVLTHGVIVVPATVLAEARARIPAAGADILEIVLDLPNTVVAELDPAAADVCGRLLTRVSDDHRDQVSAAHAAAEGATRGWPVATDRGELLTKFDPAVEVDCLP